MSEFDDTVDVVCIGSGPGVLAYALCCDAADRDVLLLAHPVSDLDPDTAGHIDAMYEDLGDAEPQAVLELITAETVAVPRTTRGTVVETFVGQRLREWSAQCTASAFGVMLTAVPEDLLMPMRTDAGESITAAIVGALRPDPARPGPTVCEWIDDEIERRGLSGIDGHCFAGFVYEEGEIVGVGVDTPSGRQRVEVTGCVAMSVGAVPAQWPAQPDLADATGDVQIALIGRRAGRFARVGLLT